MAVFSVKLGHDHVYPSTTKHPWHTTKAGQQGRAKKSEFNQKSKVCLEQNEYEMIVKDTEALSRK